MAKIPESVPWQSLRTLGAGGQSTVELVAPKDGMRGAGVFALKRLRNTESVAAIQRFRNEISALEMVNDPRIVKIVDCNTDSDKHNGFLYYVMATPQEYQSLDKVALDKTKSPFYADPRASLKFVAECAEAIESAHQAGVIHRDIKLNNILVPKDRPSDSVMIIDFGCCFLTESGSLVDLTETDEAVGTPHFRPPECEPGVARKIDRRSDVYSLGKIL